MSSRRGKKPPDPPLSSPRSTLTLRHALILDLPSSPLRSMVFSCIPDMLLGLCPDFNQISNRLTVVVDSAPAFGVWLAPRSTLDCKLSSGYCSSAWRLPVGQASSGIGTRATVRAGVSFQPPHLPRLDPVRYGKVALRVNPPSPSDQVWVSPTLPLWVLLIPFPFTVLCVWLSAALLVSIDCCFSAFLCHPYG